MSYEDLSDPLRSNFVKWIHSADKRVDMIRLGKFILDVPHYFLNEIFKEEPQIVCSFLANILEFNTKTFTIF